MAAKTTGIKSRIAEFAKEYRQLENRVAATEAAYQSAQTDFRQLREERFPALMDELGQREFTLDDGTTVQKIERITAEVSRRNEVEAAKVFKRLGASDMVQQGLTFKFGVKEKAQLIALRKFTDQNKIFYEVKNLVHPMTLKAWVADKLKEGKLKLTDLDALGVYRVMMVKLKEPKK